MPYLTLGMLFIFWYPLFNIMYFCGLFCFVFWLCTRRTALIFILSQWTQFSICVACSEHVSSFHFVVTKCDIFYHRVEDDILFSRELFYSVWNCMGVKLWFVICYDMFVWGTLWNKWMLYMTWLYLQGVI